MGKLFLLRSRRRKSKKERSSIRRNFYTRLSVGSMTSLQKARCLPQEHIQFFRRWKNCLILRVRPCRFRFEPASKYRSFSLNSNVSTGPASLPGFGRQQWVEVTYGGRTGTRGYPDSRSRGPHQTTRADRRNAGRGNIDKRCPGLQTWRRKTGATETVSSKLKVKTISIMNP